ncbi:MAG TPA: thioredoxin domain-containing protein [Parcubacteria group bacterium]|jgi:thiol-disulfide isomerase/thioredoxin|nr:thioredoxin domain-containing protein [Parcubacteria group bacterium]
MKKYGYILIAVVLLAGIVYLVKTPGKPGVYDNFAQCIKDKGAVFYGAFWCPHCQSQKSKFGKSAKLLPYVECSTPDSKGQTQICKDVGITTYPTWHFTNDVSTTTKVITGDMELSDLSRETNCPLPEIQ